MYKRQLNKLKKEEGMIEQSEHTELAKPVPVADLGFSEGGF